MTTSTDCQSIGPSSSALPIILALARRTGWPDGNPQQVHLDLHVDDPAVAHTKALALGARLISAAPDITTREGHQVYADPAGHPFCIGWGHPDDEAVCNFLHKTPTP